MITIKDVQYQAKKMPPRQQFHVMRRLTPLLTAAGPLLLDLLDSEKPKDEVLTNIAGVLGPISVMLAGMRDDDLDYVLDACMLVIERLDVDNRWHPIAIAGPRGVQRMYQDIDAVMELRLTAEALKVNLSGFFGQLSDEVASPLSSPGAASTAAA